MKAVLFGGGYLNRPSEGQPFLKRAVQLAGGFRIAVFPTPLSSLPCEELDSLRRRHNSGIEGTDTFQTLTTTTQERPDYGRAKELLEWANVVAILGGNFAEGMHRWRATGIDELLLEAAASGRNDLAFVGGSFGLVSWFDRVQTRDRRLGVKMRDKYRADSGLGHFPAFVTAHATEVHPSTGIYRGEDFRSLMQRQPAGSVGIAVGTRAGVLIDGDELEFMDVDRTTNVQRLVCVPRLSGRSGSVPTTAVKASVYRPADGPFRPLSLRDFFDGSIPELPAQPA